MPDDEKSGAALPLRERRGTRLTDTERGENDPAHADWADDPLPDPELPHDDPETPLPLITAEQAYPVLERCFLEAERQVRMSFRVFDPFARVHSKSAREIGDVWFDLIAHKLGQGVRVELVLTDFDPVAVPAMHAMTWDAVRGLLAAGEASGRPELLSVEASLHPARVGVVPRALLWYRSWSEIRRVTRRLASLPKAERAEMLRLRPGLRRYVTERKGRLVPRIWPIPELTLATHHQKIAVFDDRWLYIGGLDLDDRRYDTLRHDRPAQETWHDVQLLLGGPAVRDAHRHLDSFRNVTHGAAPPDTGQVLRTISARRSPAIFRMSPDRKVSELYEAHRALIGGARDLLYVETQFMRDRNLARRIVRAGRANPGLGLVMVIPAAPEDAAFSEARVDARYGDYLQARCISKIRRQFGERALILSPAEKRRADDRDKGPRARLWRAPIVYVHAKVAIADGREAIVSSANMNGRSMHWDTEAGVVLDRAGTARRLRDACMAHWMGEEGPQREDETGPELVARWRGMIEADRGRVPELRRGLLLPYPLRPAWRLGRNVPGVPEAMV
ncbi:phospholipase D-like domain-containing protein [Limimaricola pyoseonensis]|uniref:Phospholipase D n=1 Tax=Limimaricola pyoseonensis TaxID=521013 RepID=A0A1G6ZNM3_9RHOB|nr:phospholipase D-like domain-containing protein [Limimaricola pyoseonensis]SDE03166.1 phospholipase D1/2 [Limimaricola pyoseonensis]